MRDIRKRYQNSKSSAHVVSSVKNEKHINSKARELVKEAEMFEKNDYKKEIEYDRSGKPIMKAADHFDFKKHNGRGKKDELDVLKRQAFFDSQRREFDEGDIKDFRRKRSNKKKLKDILFYSAIILIIGIGLLWSFVFNSATITITPKYKDLEVSDTFLLFKDDILIDNSSSTLSKTVLKSAPKQINQKATGIITIYNNSSEAPQTLIKNTRFQTADGKVFRIIDSVVVPGKKGSTPGSIDAKVSADSYGADYNIGATDFKIPGFKGIQKYNLFYGKSTSAMTGGISGTVSVVSNDDITIANRDLKPSLNDISDSAARKIAHDGYFSLYDNLIINYSDNQSSLMTSGENSYILTANSMLISIKKEILAKMIAQQVLKDNFNSDEMVRIDDISNLTFTLDPDMDLINSNILKVLITGKVRIIWDYNKNNIINSLSGQKSSIFGEVLKDYNSSIIESNYKISPFWLKSFPKSVNKIKIDENLK
ncbi:MAG: hypothetical protein QG630_315 [Patescibacteria group bacterium]|nr:hypothetical protein [Patescibacteria group bacterium]